MKKYFLSSTLVVSSLALEVFSNSEESSADGYIQQPTARGNIRNIDSLEKSTISWSQAFAKYGDVIANPPS